MTVGTGLFLSSVVIAAAWLIVRIHARLNWKKISIWAAVVLGAGPCIVGGSIYAYEYWNARPLPQTELWGIALGDSEDDVKFQKGPPSTVKEVSDPTAWTYALNSDGSVIMSIKEGDTAAQVYVVRFREHRVRYVEQIFGELPALPSLGGITSSSSLREVQAALGTATNVSRSADGEERLYSFDRYKVAFTFRRAKMAAQAIYDPKSGPLRFADDPKK